MGVSDVTGVTGWGGMVTIAEKLKIGQFGAATTKVLVHFHRTGGMAYPHPITVPEQAALLRRKPNAVVSKTHWPGGKRVRGASLKVYCRGDFEIAWRKHDTARDRAGPRLRLVQD